MRRIGVEGGLVDKLIVLLVEATKMRSPFWSGWGVHYHEGSYVQVMTEKNDDIRSS